MNRRPSSSRKATRVPSSIRNLRRSSTGITTWPLALTVAYSMPIVGIILRCRTSLVMYNFNEKVRPLIGGWEFDASSSLKSKAPAYGQGLEFQRAKRAQSDSASPPYVSPYTRRAPRRRPSNLCPFDLSLSADRRRDRPTEPSVCGTFHRALSWWDDRKSCIGCECRWKYLQTAPAILPQSAGSRRVLRSWPRTCAFRYPPADNPFGPRESRYRAAQRGRALHTFPGSRIPR